MFRLESHLHDVSLFVVKYFRIWNTLVPDNSDKENSTCSVHKLSLMTIREVFLQHVLCFHFISTTGILVHSIYCKFFVEVDSQWVKKKAVLNHIYGFVLFLFHLVHSLFTRTVRSVYCAYRFFCCKICMFCYKNYLLYVPLFTVTVRSTCFCKNC